jgi:ubiquinone/menaquinone biosynthesis C-methylase UbiE
MNLIIKSMPAGSLAAAGQGYGAPCAQAQAPDEEEEHQTMGADDIAAVFDAAHADFVELSPNLWGPLGDALVARSRPTPGERVLDACCGSGASALPAAKAVGEQGHVDGIDVAGALLAHGRAAAVGLPQLHFTRADVTAWAPTGGAYDLVQSGFGVFFLPDMDAASARLVGLLRHGGRFAVQTWRQGALVAFAECLFDEVRAASATPPPTPSPSTAAERINTADKLAGWLATLGLTDVEVTEIPFRPALTPELAWGLVCGTGFRGLLSSFDGDTTARIRAGLLRRLDDRGLRTLDAGSLVGIGVRP